MEVYNLSNKLIKGAEKLNFRTVEEFIKSTKDLPGYAYQYNIIKLNEKFARSLITSVTLFRTGKDFDPMLAVNGVSYMKKIHPFILKVLASKNTVSERALIIETFFPIHIRQDNLSNEDIIKIFNDFLHYGVKFRRLTLELCRYFCEKRVVNKGEFPVFEHQLPVDTDNIAKEIDTLFMIVDGNESDYCAADDPFLQVVEMINFNENYLDIFEMDYNFVSEDVDDRNVHNIDEFALSRRTITRYPYAPIHRYYNRIIEELVTDMNASRFVYCKSIMYLFKNVMINPYFAIPINKSDLSNYKLQRYGFALIVAYQVIHSRKTPNKIDPIRIHEYDMSIPFEDEEVKKQIALQLMNNTEGILSKTTKQEMLRQFINETLSLSEVLNIAKVHGLIRIYQLCRIVLMLKNAEWITFGNVIHTKENMKQLLDILMVSPDAEWKETRFLYIDEVDYSSLGIKLLFSRALKGKQPPSFKCKNCSRSRYQR